MCRVPLSLALLFASATAVAGPPSTVVLRAAHVFDGKSDALVSPGVVVIGSGKILAVGPRAAIPAGAQVIDLGDATLMPGLFDAHTHLSFEASDDWKQDQLDALKKPLSQLTLEATVYARKTLMAGFTSVRDLGSIELIDVGLRNAIDEGAIVGPRMQVATYAIGARGGHVDWTGGYAPDLFKEPDTTRGVASGPDEIRAAVRFDAKHGADVIKTAATGGVLSEADKVDSPQLTQAELNALVDEAHALGRKAAAHAHGNEGARRAILAGIDSIEHGTFVTDDTLDLMKKHGTVLVYTPVVCLADRMKRTGTPANVVAKSAAADAAQEKMFQRALARGVRLGFGSDAAVCPHGTQLAQFRHMVGLGMKPLAALRSATSVDAALLGVDSALGSLEPGKLADVVAVPGDPSTNIGQMERLFFVMKGGVVVRNDRPGTPPGREGGIVRRER